MFTKDCQMQGKLDHTMPVKGNWTEGTFETERVKEELCVLYEQVKSVPEVTAVYYLKVALLKRIKILPVWGQKGRS